MSQTDSVAALIWGSAAGWLASLGCVLGQRLLSLGEAMEAWTAGTREVLEPVFVLLLAWALGAVIADVCCANTADDTSSCLAAYADVATRVVEQHGGAICDFSGGSFVAVWDAGERQGEQLEPSTSGCSPRRGRVMLHGVRDAMM